MRPTKEFVRLSIIIIILFTLGFGFFYKTPNGSRCDDSEFIESQKDSVINLSYDMEDMIEYIFSNQGYKLPEGISMNNVSDRSISLKFNKHRIYAYISPMSCWSCVRIIKNHLISNKNITFLIPNKFSADIQPFLDYVEIPYNQVYVLSKNLELPIEETNKVFLFTIKDSSTISNVFPPSKYSRELTETYLNSISIN